MKREMFERRFPVFVFKGVWCKPLNEWHTFNFILMNGTSQRFWIIIMLRQKRLKKPASICLYIDRPVVKKIPSIFPFPI
jgi:hypothetical protein